MFATDLEEGMRDHWQGKFFEKICVFVFVKDITAVCINNETSAVVCKQRKIQP